MNFTKILLFLTLGITQALTFDLKFYMNNLIGGDLVKITETGDSVPSSTAGKKPDLRGQTSLSFLDFITYYDRDYCGLQDEFIAGNDKKKQIIKVKCVQDKEYSEIQIASHAKLILNALKPYGNSTKRNVEGNCLFVLFYTKTCHISAEVAPYFNALSRRFPFIRLYAIDAFKYPSFNTDFGIIGLPTAMLFHQGRPVVKLNNVLENVKNFGSFLTKHTDIKPANGIEYLPPTPEDYQGPLSSVPEEESKNLLILAWMFIASCAGFYFSKTAIYAQITDVIKKNWRESEVQAQMERR
ncbi:TXNDC15 family protein [Megaselia abdita]